MWSKELQILDRNTVKYMIDDLQEQLDDAKEQLDDTKEQLDSANATIATLLAKLKKYESENDSKT